MCPSEKETADLESTRELIVRFREGDREVIDILLERFYDRVYAVVHSRLPAAMRPRYDTGDVVQESMVRVLKHMDRFEYSSDGAFFSWICIATESALVDLIRHSSRQCRSAGKEVSLSGTDAPEPLDVTGNPEEEASRNDQYAWVMAGLDQLPEELKRVVLYREFGRLSWKELGEAIDVSTVTARRYYLRALSLLGRILSG